MSCVLMVSVMNDPLTGRCLGMTVCLVALMLNIMLSKLVFRSASIPAEAILLAQASYATDSAAGKRFVKVAGGKNKQSGEADVRIQAAIAMLTKPDEPRSLFQTPEQSQEALKKTEKYHEAKELQKAEWIQDMKVKHALQMDALRALPAALRAKAQQPDLTPYPPNRKFLFDTPPTAYQR